MAQVIAHQHFESRGMALAALFERHRQGAIDGITDAFRIVGIDQQSGRAFVRGACKPREDEHTGIIGDGFSVGVAQAWEKAAVDSCPPGTRLVLLRSAMVMSPDRGGIFDVLLGLVRRGLGGSAAGGRQYVSWIHGEDFGRALRFLIEHDVDGPVNVAAPNPLPYADFMRALREAWGARLGLPATRWMLELGAWAMRTETELVLKSRRVVPARLLEHGFTFRFPDWRSAAPDLCRQWKAARDKPLAA